jgi:hypothetical protein
MAVTLNKTNIQAAKMLLDHPLFEEIFGDMEASAINQAINAQLTDDATRSSQLSEARAIRSLRQKLRFMVSHGEATSGDKGASE